MPAYPFNMTTWPDDPTAPPDLARLRARLDAARKRIDAGDYSGCVSVADVLAAWEAEDKAERQTPQSSRKPSAA